MDAFFSSVQECASHVTMFFVALILISATAVAARWPGSVEYPSSGQNSFDITKFGAVGDGRKDNAKEFKSAWTAACGAGSKNATIVVPSGTFLVSSIEFEGPCKSSRVMFMISGKIVAPPKEAWKEKSRDVWLRFHEINGLVVSGNGKGTIDGQGETWWKKASDDNSRPTALQFSHCNNLQLRGLNHANSQKNHISINGCRGADISGLSITAPEDSPNTDGIDISSSTNIYVRSSVIATGDDCIAINSGSSAINITGIKCGPGHGISIGSLGKNGHTDQVQGITVAHCSFRRSENGARIKTWQGGSGFAKNIVFSDIEFDRVENPVLIDQFYCPHKTCPVKPSAVKISDVRYTGLRGTTNNKEGNAINFNCSKTVPCTGIVLENIKIQLASNGGGLAKASCNNAQVSGSNGLTCREKDFVI
ncbi:probable polygalacturonase At3g15720 [Andrographis paniculata]|uniref:probable polygalacturonase At3g15720 n=1 Tax=Andrographis paniculata TaxID=175694 RepID=UPI0021E7BF51|nr:probable polygalacturonase At3g15720 [Andrographis paniculata]